MRCAVVCLPLLVEGEYDPWEMERRSGLWLLLEEETGSTYLNLLTNSFYKTTDFRITAIILT